MKLTTWLKSALARFSRGSTRAGWMSAVNKQPVRPELSDAVLISHYRSWAYTCATKNSTFVASTPLRLYATKAENEPRSRQPSRRLSKAERMRLEKHNLKIAQNPRFKAASEVEEIYEHPFMDLLDQINEWRDQYETFEETQLFLDITGDAYWMLGFSPLGIPNRVYLLPSHRVKIVPDKSKFIRGYLYGTHYRNEIALKPEEVIHFRSPNPRDQYYGMGCMEATFRSIIQYESMEDYETALNQNLGIPGIFLSYDGDLTDDQIDELELRWNKALAGVQKSGKVKVGTSKFTLNEIGKSPREMGFLQGRKWTRDEICAAFGVPVDLIATDNSNRASSLIAFNTYASFTILPRLCRIEDKLNANLLPFYNEPRLFVAYDDPRKESEEVKTDNIVKKVENRIITRDEARAEFGLPPLTDEQQAELNTQPGVPDETQSETDE